MPRGGIAPLRAYSLSAASALIAPAGCAVDAALSGRDVRAIGTADAGASGGMGRRRRRRATFKKGLEHSRTGLRSKAKRSAELEELRAHLRLRASDNMHVESTKRNPAIVHRK